VLPPPQHRCHAEMAVCTKRGQIFRKLGAKSFVGAMMHLQLRLACIAEATAVPGGLQLSKARRVGTPVGAGDVSQVALMTSFFLPWYRSITDCGVTCEVVTTISFRKESRTRCQITRTAQIVAGHPTYGWAPLQGDFRSPRAANLVRPTVGQDFGLIAALMAAHEIHSESWVSRRIRAVSSTAHEWFKDRPDRGRRRGT
jgi:hypothetical protein